MPNTFATSCFQPLRLFRGRVVLPALGLAALLAPSLSGAGPSETGSSLLGTEPLSGTSLDPRHGERRASSPPPGSIVRELQSRSSERLAFSPLVDALVEGFSATDFDQRIRDLSGENPVTIGGTSYTFHTRYTRSTGGQKSWQYAYEQLEALGLAVRYQDYVRSGNHYQNVIATIPGEVTPEQVYVVGGHIDSISSQAETLAPGAEDNGSGSSAVLAIAAVFAGQRFESTIELVLFSGEEQGLWGSEAYVAEAVNLGVDLRGAVIMDMIAYYNNDYGVTIEGETAWVDLMGAFGDAIDRYTSLDKVFTYYSWGSDHVPFQDANIPAFLAIDLDWDEYPYYHTTQDTYNRTTPALGVEIARAALATVAQLAGPLESPSGVETPTYLADAEGPRLHAYPNPANSSVWIELTQTPIHAPADPASPVGIPGHSPLLVTDVSGRILRRISAPESGAAHGWSWDLRNEQGVSVTPGVYWARLGEATERIVVVR